MPVSTVYIMRFLSTDQAIHVGKFLDLSSLNGPPMDFTAFGTNVELRYEYFPALTS